MLIFRWLATLLILTSALSFAFYLGTGKAHYKRLGFFAVQVDGDCRTGFFLP